MDEKKISGLGVAERLPLLEKGGELSERKQCELLSLNRSRLHYRARRAPGRAERRREAGERMERLYSEHPVYGYRRMGAALRREGLPIGDKAARSLMRELGLRAIYPKPRLSASGKESAKAPYLLKGKEITRRDQVWSTDITYLKIGGRKGWAYLTAVMDWHSRRILSWRLGTTADVGLCLDVLEDALNGGARPETFNTDQGCQYTSAEFQGRLKGLEGVQVSMDGKGRAYDNILMERFWRTVKYEEVFLREYGSVREARRSIGRWIRHYNGDRPHQGLGYRTPDEVYFGEVAMAASRAASGATPALATPAAVFAPLADTPQDVLGLPVK